MFSCGFYGKRFKSEGTTFRSGIITFDSLQEVFDAPLATWDEEAYETSWQHALQLLSKENCTASAIITRYIDLNIAPYVGWWPLYSFGENIRIREQMLFLDPIRETVTDENLFRFIPLYNTLMAEPRPSEWSVSREDVMSFLHCLSVIKN